MIIDSPVLGTVEAADDKIIEFPSGLTGFENLKRFALLHDEGEAASDLFMLLSVDSPDVLFSVTDPSRVSVHYELQLTDEESAEIQLDDPAHVATLVILRRDDSEGVPEGAGLRANFMAPLIVNLASRRGLQKVLSRVDCEVTLRSV